MRPSDLLCARCGGRVAEARCASCRVAWRDLRNAADRATAWMLVLAVALLAALAIGYRATFA